MYYYTYKITFKDLPCYFYYGKHKDDGKPYFGSPVTWKRFWKQFEPEVQILQWYNTAEEVEAAEDSIIRTTWDSKYSLNEAVGARVSAEVCRANGRKTGPGNVKSLLPYCSDNGKKSMTPDRASKFGNQTIGLCNEHINTVQSRRLNGIEAVKSGLGIFSEDYKNSDSYKEQQVENARKMNDHPHTLESNEKIKRPVLCADTGVVYPSVRGAERMSGVSRVNIRNSIRSGYRAGGFYWRYA